MSRMTKFLKQTCALEIYQLGADGSPLLNDFGEIQYNVPITCRCRRERCIQDVETSNGAILKSASRYFLDESVPILADYRIDGRVVLQVADYVNGLGRVEGYEVYT